MRLETGGTATTTSIDQWEENSNGFNNDSGDFYYCRKSGVIATQCAGVPGCRTVRSAASLQSLSLEAVLSQLLALCQQRNYVDNKRALKHYLKFQLPAPLRQHLLNLSLREGRIYTLVDLNIFELLLSPSVKEVDVQSIRPFFRQPFVAMLRQLGTGIQKLSLEDSSWLQLRDTLPSALARMTCLRHLSLRYLANDAMIAALAKNCLHLQILDVTSSSHVTDKGMELLCNPEAEWKEESGNDLSTGSSSVRSRKISAPGRMGNVSNGCMMIWLPRLVRGIRRRHSVSQHSGGPTVIAEEEDDTALLKPEEDETSSGIQQPFNQSVPTCIRSLRKLSVAGTRVTAAGVQMIMSASTDVSVVT